MSSSSIDSDLAAFLFQKFNTTLESAKQSHESDPMFKKFQDFIQELEKILSDENQTSRKSWIIRLLYEINDHLSQWLLNKEHQWPIFHSIISPFSHATHLGLDARDLRLFFEDLSNKKREPNFDLDRITFFEPGPLSTVEFQIHKKKMVEWLTTQDFKAVGVYGIGGSGKTALVKQVLDDKKVVEKFKKNIIWVCLSHLTSPDEIDMSILKYMLNYLDYDLDRLAHDKDDDEVWLLSQLKEKLRELDNYVIVFDDLWHCNKWMLDFYKEVAEDNAAIIVTSRKEEVVRDLVNGNKGDNVIHLDPWNYMDGDNSNFIEGIVSQNENYENEIISRCHGLALAANNLPQMMIQHNKGNRTDEESELETAK